MSYVTSVVLFSNHIPPATRKLLAEGYTQSDNSLICFPLLPLDFATGTKVIEADVGVGAWNYLDWYSFCTWLSTLHWSTTVVVVGEANGDTGPMVFIIPGYDEYSIKICS